MTENEAKELVLQIIAETSAKGNEIIKEAKEKGTWKMGLDANRELFEDLNKTAKLKIEEIISKIDK